MKKILVFLTDGYADWEPALIAAELSKSEYDFEVKTIALNKQPKKSMGGFHVLPDYGLDEPVFQECDIALLIVPGGTGWGDVKNHKVTSLIDACLKRNIPVAAICDGVTFLANKGYLDSVRHTGNTLEYLKQMAPNYKGQELFVEEQAVSDGNFITANGTAPIEFAREILKKLKVIPDVSFAQSRLEELGVDFSDKIAGWHALWKYGFYGR